MTKFKFIFLILVQIVTSRKVNLVSRAITDVASSHFVKNSISFDIIIYGRVTNELKTIASQVLMTNRESFGVKIFNIKANPKSQVEVSQSAILLFNSTNSFWEFNRKVQILSELAELSFLAYCATISDGSNAFVTPILFFQFILIPADDRSLKMLKFTPFHSNACRRMHFTEINRFFFKTLKWIKALTMITGIEDFDGCELVIAIPSLFKPFTDFIVHENGSFVAYGAIVDFFGALGKFYNFTIVYSPKDTVEQKFLHPNLLLDFTAFLQSQKGVSRNRNGLTQTFTTYEYGFIIPHGELYTPLEKLILPFDNATWICFLVFFIAGVVVIKIINLMEKAVQHFFYGRNVNTPTLNLFRVFFGLSLPIIPRRNFARYILMTFILFCLIIRTAYQGKMFEFLQLDIRKPEVKSVSEMIEKNFTFYCYESMANWNENSEMFRGFVLENNFLISLPNY